VDDPELTVGTVDARMHRYYDVDTNQYFDVGLVLLDQDLPIEPMTIAPDASAAVLGATATIVGYGFTGASLTDYGTKHRADITLSVVSKRRVRYSGLPSACKGDSGSPLLIPNGNELEIVGINTSSDCASWSVALLLEPYLEDFIYPVMDRWEGRCREDGVCVEAGCRTPDPDCTDCAFNDKCGTDCPEPDLDCPARGVFLDPCSDDRDCESGICLPDLRSEVGGYCTLPCSGVFYAPVVCGELTQCSELAGIAAEPVCAYPFPPRPDAAICRADAQCASGYCASDGTCARTCQRDTDCGPELGCIRQAEGSKLCGEPAPGGCAVAGRDGSGGGRPMAVMLLLALWAAWRARSARRQDGQRRNRSFR
jgi:hypothetical protein